MPTIEYQAQVGVGDGSGTMFVYGSYDAVKRVQSIILENERLRAAQAFNQLSNAEAERLALLVEELGEAAQMVGKTLCHGYESSHPDYGDKTNRQLLQQELGDVKHSIARLCHEGDLDGQLIDELAHLKRKRVSKFLHHN